MQLESQLEATKLVQTESQLEATKLVQTEFDGLKSQTVGPKPEIEVHDEISETHSKSKELVLARYVRRDHAPDQIIGENFDVKGDEGIFLRYSYKSKA